MRVKIENGIQYTKESDYLSASENVKINHALIDVQTEQVLEQRMMSVTDKEKMNKALMKKIPLKLWSPLLYK